MTPLFLGGLALGVMAVWMTLAWVLSRLTNNAGWVDVAWTLGFLPVLILCLVFGEAPLARRILLVAMVALWSLRLGTYLAVRVGRHPLVEDPRYAALRAQFPRGTWAVFFVFFQIQGVLVVVLSAPFFAAAFNSSPFPGWLEMAGVCVWLTGIVGESMADAQLAAFRKNPSPSSRVCDTGLWRYSRHPNYFFEWVIWIGFAVFGAGGPGGWAGFAAPAIMYFLLTKVTGIPPAEARARVTKGDAFRDYCARTSPFFPRPPKGS